MRFIIENGGRSGARDVEALAHILEATHHRSGKDGRLFVDYSPTNSGPRSEFKQVHELLRDMSEAISAAIEAKRGTGKPPDLPAMWLDLARRYWAEAEAMEIARASLPLPSNAAGKRL